MAQLMRFMMMVLITSLLSSCVVKTTNRRVGSRPLNIQDIRVAEGSDKTIVEVEGEGLMLFTTFRLTAPDRLVLEISEVGLGKYHDEIAINEGPIHSILPVPSGDIHVSRLEFLLSGPVRTDVRPEGLNIIVEVTQLDGKGKDRVASDRNNFKFFQDRVPPRKREFNPPDKGGKKSTGSLAKAVPPPVVTPVVPPVSVKPSTPSPSKKASKSSMLSLAAATKVMSLQFIEGKDLKMLISMNGKSTPKVFYSDRTKKHIVLDFPGVRRNMKGRRIPGDGRIVQRVRTGIHPDKLRLVIDLLKPVDYTVAQDQNEVEIIFTEKP